MRNELMGFGAIVLALSLAGCGQTGPLYLSHQDKAKQAELIKKGELPDSVLTLKPKGKKNDSGVVDTTVA